MDITDKVQKNVPLASYTTFHIGGPADQFLIVRNRNELIDAVKYAKKNNLNFFVLGTGANILIGDKGFRGLVIKNESENILSVTENVETETWIVESGITIERLINMTAEKGLSGVEHFAGIPSTLGGAIWQNLHFLSPDRLQTVFIAEIVERAKILKVQELTPLDSSKDIEVDKAYFHFAYDYSILHDTHDVVLSVTLKFNKSNKEIIIKTIDANIDWRNEKHPENAAKKSAGSVFKKIPSDAKALAGKEGGAGRFIDQVGLKGYKIGGAQISEKHANFIINTGNATAKDVRDLIKLVQEKVKDKLDLSLETEISFIGEF